MAFSKMTISVLALTAGVGVARATFSAASEKNCHTRARLCGVAFATKQEGEIS